MMDEVCQGFGGDAKARSTLLKVLGNVVKDPSNEKFRKLRVTNPVIAARIMEAQGALAILQAVGFVEEGEFLVLTGDDVQQRAQLAVEALMPKDWLLSLTLQITSDVRGVCWGRSLLATASLDNVARVFDPKGALVRECRAHTQPARSDGGVLGVRLRPDGRLYSAGRDGALVAYAADGQSCTRHVGHGDAIEGEPRLTNAQIVSCVAVSDELVVTGGWDRTCIAWDTEGDGAARRYGPFGAAVNGLCLFNGRAAAVCGDGSLNVFDPSSLDTSANASHVNVLADARGPPMRGVTSFDDTIATVSNDGVLRLWDDNRLTKGVQASEVYLFAVCYGQSRLFVGGDDKVISIFQTSLALEARIPCPASIWALDVDRDLLVGCEAPFGALVFSRDPTRAAPAIVADNIRNVSGEALALIAASTDPPVRLGADARPQKLPSASNDNNSVSMGGGFDYSYPVDLGAGGNLQLDWNRDDDVERVAVDFCNQHGIPRHQTGQVADFMHQVMGQVPPSNPAGTPGAAAGPSATVQADMIAQVMALGVNEARAREALEKANWASIEAAINFLF